MIGIKVHRDEPIDKALRRFKQKFSRSGILREFRNRTAFVKPSVEKRLNRIKSARKQYKISKDQS